MTGLFSNDNEPTMSDQIAEMEKLLAREEAMLVKIGEDNPNEFNHYNKSVQMLRESLEHMKATAALSKENK